jgi:hypothetical protein
MRSRLRAQTTQQSSSLDRGMAAHPAHTRDVGRVHVLLLECWNLRCSNKWFGVSREPITREQAEAAIRRCPKCDSERTRQVGPISPAIAEVNAKAGVLRFQMLVADGDGVEVPTGEWKYVPWDSGTIP